MQLFSCCCAGGGKQSAGYESVTPEPVKGVAKSEEARPLPSAMGHSNKKKTPTTTTTKAKSNAFGRGAKKKIKIGGKMWARARACRRSAVFCG